MKCLLPLLLLLLLLLNEASTASGSGDSFTLLDNQFAKDHFLPLLELNDELRELLVHEKDIPVSSIVAIGDQSSGKSSVLEALSGIELPRGEGIKTKVPLIMHMRPLKDSSEPYAEIGIGSRISAKRIKITDIAEKIDELTATITKGQPGVADIPIDLTVYQSNVVSLTIIDLPGMVRSQMEGQPENITEIIKNMIMKRIKEKSTIILNVVSATVDIAVTESLTLSRSVDPTGERTILCFTKVDVEKGSLKDKLLSSEKLRHRLKPGHTFAVRNRQTSKNGDTISLVDARAQEQKFFDSNSELQEIKDKVGLGIYALSSRLVEIQSKVIKEQLQGLGDQASRALKKHKESLSSIGDSLTELERRVVFHKKLTKFRKAFRYQIFGETVDLEPEEVIFGENKLLAAMLFNEFQSLRNKLSKFEDDKFFNADHTMTFKLLEDFDMMKRGTQILFPGTTHPVIAVEVLRHLQFGIKDQIVPYVTTVHDLTIEVLKVLVAYHFKPFDLLYQMTRSLLMNFYEQKKEVIIKELEKLLASELVMLTMDIAQSQQIVRLMQYVLDNPEGAGKEASNILAVLGTDFIRDPKAQKDLTPEKKALIPLHIQTYVYWKLMMKRVIDLTIVTIGSSLASTLAEDDLVGRLQKGFDLYGPDNLMADSPSVVQERNYLKERIDKLEEALKKLHEKGLAFNMKESNNGFTEL